MLDYSRDRYAFIGTREGIPNIPPYEYVSSIYDALKPHPPSERTFEETYGNDLNFMAKCVFVPAGVACEQNWYYNRQENTFSPPLFINYTQSNEYLINETQLFDLTSTSPGTFSLTGVKNGNISTSAIIDNNKIKVRPNEVGFLDVELKFVADDGQEITTRIYMNVVTELTPIIEDVQLVDEL